MSGTHYVIIDTQANQAYNPRTGVFQDRVTQACLYAGVRRHRTRRRVGTLGPSKHCESRHYSLWAAMGEDRSIEIHILSKVIEDSSFAEKAGRPHIKVDVVG